MLGRFSTRSGAPTVYGACSRGRVRHCTHKPVDIYMEDHVRKHLKSKKKERQLFKSMSLIVKSDICG